MRNLILLLHLAGAILWMGGMGFMLFALRPAAHRHLQPPQRLPFVADALRHFFALVALSIALLLGSGAWLFAQAAERPAGWHAMAVLGAVMMLVFGHIWFAPYRGLQRAVAAADWPAGGARVAQITLLARVNFALGWLAIAAVLLWR